MSQDDCRNDCAEPLRFPRRPGTRFRAGKSTSEICAELERAWRSQNQEVSEDNRPGLPHINYRIGTYADIRAALLRNLDKDANLAAWTHHGADDPGIALLEGAAILGDILTFYQELYANEAYLRTAKWRESISDLVRLLGYRLSPGLGGVATFAFEVKGEKAITVPKNFPVKAEVTGLSKPADFETSEPLTAYPWLSKFNLYRRLYTPNITQATNEFDIFSPDQFLTPLQLKPGDRLLIGEPDNAANPTRLHQAEIVVVDSIRELHGRKLFRIKGTLKRSGSVSNLTAFKLGRTFHHFGHNGPRKITKTSTSTPISEYNHSFYRDLTNPTNTNETPYTNFRGLVNSIQICDPSLTQFEFPLDSEVNDLPAGTRLVIEMLLYKDSASPALDVTLVRTIKNIHSSSQTFGLITGSASVVELNQQLNVTVGGGNYNVTDARQMLVYEVLSPQLTLKAAMQEDLTMSQGVNLLFYGTDAQAQNLKSRRVFFEKPGAAPFSAVVTAVEAESTPSLATRQRVRLLTLDSEFTYADFPNVKPMVTVYGNLVDATQGKTEAQAVLGNGDNRQAFQVFKVPKSPLTYLLSLGESPPESPKLQIYVNDRLWKRVPTFFGHKYDEEIYIVREDANNDSWVQFGDGKTGARLPSGIKNVVAKYRTGTGAFGALKPETKVQAGARLDKLDKVQMPGAAAGGSAPESGENAREAAPGKIQSLDRLVSLKDFESETLAISGVTRATASWELEDNIAAVFITVLMETGRQKEIEDVRQVLAGYNLCRGPHRFPVKVREGKLQYVFVDLIYGLDPTYREDVVTPAIEKALGATSAQPATGGQPATNGQPASTDVARGLFSLRQRRFGEREYATRVAGSVQNVAGVLWAKVEACMSLGEAVDGSGQPIDPAEIPAPLTKTLNEKVLCDGLHILALHGMHLVVKAAAEPNQGVCL